MVGYGSLMSSLTPRVIAAVVSGETYVPATLLLEDEEFLNQMAGANSMEELVEWVNENY